MITATIIPYEDGIYEGQVVNGEPHGWGKLTYLNDVVYEGEWRKGQEHGHGTITWRNGNSFSGKFDQGKPISTTKYILTQAYELEQKKQQIGEMQLKLAELMEDFDIQKETTMQVQLTLDMWHSRFDTLFQIAKDAGADESLLVAIRNGDEYV